MCNAVISELAGDPSAWGLGERLTRRCKSSICY